MSIANNETVNQLRVVSDISVRRTASISAIIGNFRVATEIDSVLIDITNGAAMMPAPIVCDPDSIGEERTSGT